MNLILILALLAGAYAIISLIIVGVVARAGRARKAGDKRAFYALGLTDTHGKIEA